MSKAKTSNFQELNQIVFDKKLSNFKMVAFDMDGTLLSSDHQLSSRTITAVRLIADAGILILLATGRMTSAVKKHLDKLGTSGLVVSHNGALVNNVKTGEIYHHRTISKNVISKVLELLKGKKTIVHFNFGDHIYFTKNNPYSKQYSQDLEVSLTYSSSFSNLEGEPTSILLMDTKDVLKELLAILINDLNQSFSSTIMPWKNDVWWLQILPTKTSKGRGVLQAAVFLNITPKEIISFGDNYNDMDMLQNTGLGIAMGNAVPELKQIADFVTVSNQEDGVALVLETLLQLSSLSKNNK